MILYHRTNRKTAEAILSGGFRDGTGKYMADREFTGLWLSNVPLDGNEGPRGEILLKVSVRASSAELRAKYEWLEPGKPYREFLIPAVYLNKMVRKSK